MEITFYWDDRLSLVNFQSAFTIIRENSMNIRGTSLQDHLNSFAEFLTAKIWRVYGHESCCLE